MRTVGRTYLMIGVILAAFFAVLETLVRADAAPVQGAALIRPVIALVLLTAIVGILMGVSRNVAVMRGAVPARYFRSFAGHAPAEWIERPARAYMNLLELPVLFYVVCLLMLTT